MENKKILLSDIEENKSLNIELKNKSKLLRENDYNVILDSNEQYIKERENSSKYKLYGKIKMVFRNQYIGMTTYKPLLKNLYLEGDGTGNSRGNLPYNEFAFVRNDISYQYNKLPQGTDLNSYSPQLELRNNPEHVIIDSLSNTSHNWGMCLSYVFDKDPNYQINYTYSNGVNFNNPISEGIPFRVTDTPTHYVLTSPIKNGFKEGEFILISNKGCSFLKKENGVITPTTDQKYRLFQIESVGNQTFDSENFVLNLPKSEFINGTTLPLVIFGRRCIDKDKDYTISQYYVRKHKILTNENDYTLDKLGFETNIWEHERKILFENALGENDVIVDRNRMETVLFDIKKTYEHKDIKDNFGFKPKEIFLTVYFKNGNGYFNYPPKVGHKFNFHSKWVSKHFEGTTSNENGIEQIQKTNLCGEKTLTSGKLSVGDIVKGDIVEYNEYELKENLISETFHKITSKIEFFFHGQNTSNSSFKGVNNNNLSGLYYKTHYPIKLREESPYVETSDDPNVTNLPENSKFFTQENQWRWRDTYEYGYIDDKNVGLNYPFMNGVHYIATNFNFYLRSEYYYTNKIDEIKKFDKPQNDFC